MENTPNSHTHPKKFRDLNIKDKISYYVSFFLIGTAVLISFLSFFLYEYKIDTSILIYVSQCFLVSGSLIGASVYFKSKWVEFNSNMSDQIKNYIDNIVNREQKGEDEAQ